MEERINLNLFEGLFCCSLVPNFACSFASFMIVMALLGKYSISLIPLIIYLCAIIFWFISILLFLIFDKKSPNAIVLQQNSFYFVEKKHIETYSYSQVVGINYNKCSTAMLLFPFIMYLNGRGVCILKFKTGKRKIFYLFNRDYYKLIHRINKNTNIIDSSR